MNQPQIRIHDQLTPGIADQWQDLWRRSEFATAFNSPVWFMAVLEADNIDDYRIVACYGDGRLQAVLPLVRSRRFAVPVWTNPGDKFFTEKSALLIEESDPTLLRLLCQALSKQGSFYLSEIDAQTTEFMCKEEPFLLATVSSVNPYLHLHLYPFRDMPKKASSKLRNIITKYRKSLRFKQYHENLSEHFQTVVAIESRSRKHARGQTVFNKPRALRFFQALMKHCQDFVRIDFLYLNGKPIIYNIGLKWKNTYLTYQTAFLDEFRVVSPGKLLLSYLITSLHNQGMWMFDFARGHSSLKREFTRDHVLQYDLYHSPSSIIRTWWLVINAARRLKQLLSRPRHSNDNRFLFRRLRIQPEVVGIVRALSL